MKSQSMRHYLFPHCRAKKKKATLKVELYLVRLLSFDSMETETSQVKKQVNSINSAHRNR